MASICYKIFSALFAFLLPFRLFAEPIKADVCVYGGTSAGVIAAEAVAKAGKTVVLVEPGRHLGGLSSGGLGQTDIGNKMVIGGMSRDFYRRVGKHYGKAEGWQFAPSVAEKVFGAIVDENRERVRAMFQFRIVRARKEGSRIREIILEHALTDDYNAPAERGDGQSVSIEAGEFIDASYEGDLMAAAGVKYTVGREGVSQYGEPLNGVRAQTPKHQFPAGIKVDPFVKAGDPSSGLLPLMKELDPGSPGAADARVQAYNFRICLTRKKENQLRFQPPPGYDAAHFELLSRYLAALKAANHKTSLGMFLKLDVMPEDKTDINNNGAISTDFIGMSWEYPDASYGKRGKIWRAHRDYVQGFFYYMATDARVPENVRAELNQWGLCKDEFADTGGWPHQMYIREARRMVGDYVITQKVCMHEQTADDSVGMAAYNMDSHNCNRVVKDGAAINEGDVQVSPTGPYPIAYRAIVPREAECENLLVPVCLSATHIAYGSIRMEPVFMVLGESSALAACQATDERKAVQRIDVRRLQKTLRDAGQVLEYTAPAKQKK